MLLLLFNEEIYLMLDYIKHILYIRQYFTTFKYY